MIFIPIYATINILVTLENEVVTEHIAQFQQILTALQARYPHCFPPNGVDLKPLKIGIHHDLRCHLPEGVSATRLRHFLAWYTRRFVYRKHLKAGAVRVALDGSPAGEVTAEQAQLAMTPRQPNAERPPPNNPRHSLPLDAPLTEDNTVRARLELTLKFNELPQPVQVQAGYKFALDCDGRRVNVTLRPKAWNKLTAAAANYPQWVAALSGKMGPAEGNGFVLLEPALQVFEKKPKEPKEPEDNASKPASTPSDRPKLSLKSKP